MKKIYSIVLMATALLIGTNMQAADVTVVNETTGESTSYDGSSALQSAIDFIGAGETGTITLNNPITLSAAVVMPHVTGTINETTNPTVLNRAGQTITLNLNGKNITGANSKGVIQIFKGSLDITGSGEIIRGSGEGSTNFDKSVITICGAPWEKKDQVWTTLTIGKDVTVKTDDTADKVFGLCLQNTSNSPVNAATLGYSTYFSKIANAPAGACTNLSNWGCAYGVKVFVNGKVYGHMRGINVLGTINANPKCEISTSPTKRQADVYPYYDYNYPYVNIGSTAQVWCINDGVANDNNGGIYGGGYAVYDISGEIYGQTGIYLKSGDLKLTDANVYSTASTVGTSADYHKGLTAGAGIFIGSDAGYAGGTAVELEGDTRVSSGTNAEAKGIIDVVATNAQSTGSSVSHVTVEGGTIEGGIDLTSNTSNVTTVYGAQITGEVVVDGQSTTVATLTPSGTHVTTVEIDGKTTVIVSEGAGPQDDAKKTTWAEIATLSNQAAPKDVAWTAVGEGTISSDLYFGELQMISGTDASNMQKLTIESGATLNVKHLMMNNFAQIEVAPGAKLIVNGKQGIVAPSTSNIVLQHNSNTNKFATFLFDPAVSSNKHPKAQVEFSTNSWSVDASSYQWEWFGIPTYTTATSITSTVSEGTKYYANVEVFENDSWTDLGYIGGTYDNNPAVLAKLNKPFAAYNLLAYRSQSDVAPKITISGELVGNDNAVLNANMKWNTFANSYTAEIDAVTLVNYFKSNSANIDASVYIASRNNEGTLTWNAYDDEKVADTNLKLRPMQAFLLLNNRNVEETSINYSSMVYAPATANQAPSRFALTNSNTAKICVNVVNENGTWDDVELRENANTKVCEKYLNNDVNIYVVDGEKNDIVAVENLENTYVGFSTVKGGKFTLSFTRAEGRELDLIDLETGARVAVAEGFEYEFTAAANSANDYRFKIVDRNNAPTAIENTEAVKSVSGIYTITGQYMGDMNVWNTLPAGVYVINGEKRVK